MRCGGTPTPAAFATAVAPAATPPREGIFKGAVNKFGWAHEPDLAGTRCSGSVLGFPSRTRSSVSLPSSFRSEEHTSELQSLTNLVCRLLLEKKKPHSDRTAPLNRAGLREDAAVGGSLAHC